MSLIKLLSSLLRAVLLFAPVTIAIITFMYLLQDAERPGMPTGVDMIHTATPR